MRKNWFKEAFVQFKQTEISAYVRYSNFPIKLKIRNAKMQNENAQKIKISVMQ